MVGVEIIYAPPRPAGWTADTPPCHPALRGPQKPRFSLSRVAARRDAEMRRAQADALEAEAAAVSAAEAVIAAAQVRLLREHPELFVCALLPVTESPIRRGRRLANPEVPTKLALLS